MSRTERMRGLVDLRVRIRGDCDFRLIERPGLRLDDHELQRLLADLRGVADRSVPGSRLRYGVLSGDRRRFDDAVLAIVYDRGTDEAIGFNVMSLLEVVLNGRPTHVLHAGLCIVDPRHRSRGLCLALTAAPAVLAFLRNRLVPLWITNVTQVPAAAGVFATSLERVYPAPGVPGPPSPLHSDVATALMSRHRAAFGVGPDAEFDPHRFVIGNSYTGGSDDLKKSFARCAKHRDDRFNTLCHELLDYDRGDDLIQVGRMTCLQWARLILRFARSCLRIPGATFLQAARRVTFSLPAHQAAVR